MQAAAKAAAAAEAASAARAAHEEACSTYTHDEVAALEFQAHTSAEPRNLRRKSATAVISQLRDPVCSAPERLHGPGESLKAFFTPCCLCLEYSQVAAVLCMLVLREKAGSRRV